jgi:hypothetical protein
MLQPTATQEIICDVADLEMKIKLLEAFYVENFHKQISFNVSFSDQQK